MSKYNYYPTAKNVSIKQFEVVELAYRLGYCVKDMQHIRVKDVLLEDAVDICAKFIKGENEYRRKETIEGVGVVSYPASAWDYVKEWLVTKFPYLTAPFFQPNYITLKYTTNTRIEKYIYNVVPAYSDNEKYLRLTSIGEINEP